MKFVSIIEEFTRVRRVVCSSNNCNKTCSLENFAKQMREFGQHFSMFVSVIVTFKMCIFFGNSSLLINKIPYLSFFFFLISLQIKKFK